MHQTAGPTSQVGIGMETPICCSATPISSISTDYEKQIVLLRVENPAKAQLRNLLECRKCKLTFGDKDSYVQHLLSFHKRNAKRCRVGKSIADGVIIKDGKYECQFCHKAFDEKRRYNSHVGVHVRDYDKSLDSLPDDIIVQTCIEPATLVLMPSAITEVGALVEMGIAKATTPMTPMAKTSYEPDHGSPHIKQNKEDTEITVPPQNNTLEALPGTSVDEGDSGCEMIDDKLRQIVETSSTMDARISISSNAANITCDAYSNKVPSPSGMLDKNNMSGKDQKSTGSYSDIHPANEQTRATDTCEASYDMSLSPHRMLDENDNSGNERKGAENYLVVLPDNEPTHGTGPCDISHDKDHFPSNMLDENDISSNEQEKGIRSSLDSLSGNKQTPSSVAYLNEMGKSENELDNAFRSCSSILPDSEQACIVEDMLNSTIKEAELDEMENFGDGMESDLRSCHPESDKDVDVEIIVSKGVETVPKNVHSDASSLLLRSSGYFPSIGMISDKV